MNFDNISIRFDHDKEQYQAFEKSNPQHVAWDHSPAEALKKLLQEPLEQELLPAEEEKCNLTLYVSRSVKEEYLQFKQETTPVFQRYFLDNSLLKKGMEAFRQQHNQALTGSSEKRRGLRRKRREE